MLHGFPFIVAIELWWSSRAVCGLQQVHGAQGLSCLDCQVVATDAERERESERISESWTSDFNRRYRNSPIRVSTICIDRCHNSIIIRRVSYWGALRQLQGVASIFCFGFLVQLEALSRRTKVVHSSGFILKDAKTVRGGRCQRFCSRLPLRARARMKHAPSFVMIHACACGI